jgi:hypothetical protein
MVSAAFRVVGCEDCPATDGSIDKTKWVTENEVSRRQLSKMPTGDEYLES